MKRLLPVIIVLALIIVAFICLPKNSTEKTTYNSISELAGKTVAIQGGTSYEEYLAVACPEAKPEIYNEFAAVYEALLTGKADAMLTESVSFGVEKIEMPSFAAIDEPIETMKLRCAVTDTSKGTLLQKQMNEFLAKLDENGDLAELERYWVTEYDRGNAKVDKSGITGKNGTINFVAEASFEPACFIVEGGELEGFSVDIIYKFCREYGYKPNITTLSYDAMIPQLADNKVDMAVGVLADEERAEAVTFTDPFMDFKIIAVYDTGVVDNASFIDNLKENFSKTFIRESRWQMFLKGVGITLLLTIASAVLGTILGLLIYLWCSHGKKLESKFTSIICWIVESTPTVVLLMIFYYIFFGSYTISNIVVAIIAYSILFGCIFYEHIVSGVKAVGNGQVEAGRAQGFTQDQTFFKIIFPQAAEHFMPQYQGSIVSLIQETSVVGYIAIMDLTKMSDLVRARTYEAFFPLLATALIYFLIIWLLTSIVKFISKKTNKKNRPKEKILKGIKL